MLYWCNWFSWWWARSCSKHVENWNNHIEKNCASSWSFTKNHNKMLRGQQNITIFDTVDSCFKNHLYRKCIAYCPQYTWQQVALARSITIKLLSWLNTREGWQVPHVIYVYAHVTLAHYDSIHLQYPQSFICIQVRPLWIARILHKESDGPAVYVQIMLNTAICMCRVEWFIATKGLSRSASWFLSHLTYRF